MNMDSKDLFILSSNGFNVIDLPKTVVKYACTWP